MKQNNQILIIDSNALAYRALYTTSDLSHDKTKTGVVFGFLHKVFSYAKKYNTNDIIFCWDSKQNYRKAIYPEYKSGRLKKKKDLSKKEKYNLNDAYRQFDLLRESVLLKLGFSNVFMRPGYEGDDLIATITKSNDNNYIIFSNDNDLYQLINDRVLYYDMGKNKIIGVKEFKSMYEIYPLYWSDIKAIMGCTADEVEGIKGIGEKTAISYIQGNLIKGKKFEDIEKNQKIIERNRKLVYLPFDNDISLKIKNNKFKRENFIEVFNRHAFRSFLDDNYFKGIEKTFNL